MYRLNLDHNTSTCIDLLLKLGSSGKLCMLTVLHFFFIWVNIYRIQSLAITVRVILVGLVSTVQKTLVSVPEIHVTVEEAVLQE